MRDKYAGVSTQDRNASMSNVQLNNSSSDIDALRHRINKQADPVGTLIDVANGKPLRFMETDDEGNAVERLEHVTVSQRLTVLRELKDALIPKISRTDPQITEQRQNKDWNELVTKRALSPLSDSAN
jgi:hypothetical protein